ncbi:MAG: hypothetical protein J6Q58_05115 [Clostridia bacterium]|nr:hypothetical protein [Clostridia bacterium]
MDKFYKILGVDSSASTEEINEKYNILRTKYLEERFLEGEAGNEAARKLTEVENAYREIISTRSQYSQDSSKSTLFEEIESAIRNGDMRLAQEKLDSFDERNGEWHYYQSVIYYKKNWINESKKQLEIALQCDPNNEKYKNALNKINEKVSNPNNINQNWNKSGNVNPEANGEPVQQLGNEGCCQWCCDMIICNMLLNCCCNCR